MTTVADPCVSVVHAQPGGHHQIAVLIKRSYRIGPGLVPSLHDEQLPLLAEPQSEQVSAPAVAAPGWDSDAFAFKPRTDLVLQATAYAGHSPARELEVGVLWRQGRRLLRVHGPRRLERWGGGWRFSEAEPFERLTLGYERAFGGVDAAALAADGDALGELYAFLRPEWALGGCTPFHYPRNPAGVGYCTRPPADPGLVAVPNVEFVDDPLLPEQMIVAGPADWMRAPLPAGFGWYDQSWFPRCAYLGIVPEHAAGGEPRECVLGWAPPDLLRLGSVEDLQLHPFFFQGAPPGMQLEQPPLGERMQLRNLWPDHPDAIITLPDERPRVSVELPGGKVVKCSSHLSSVVLQPDAGRAVLVWSCRAPVLHRYTPDQLAAMRRAIDWKR